MKKTLGYGNLDWFEAHGAMAAVMQDLPAVATALKKQDWFTEYKPRAVIINFKRETVAIARLIAELRKKFSGKT